MTKTFHQVSFNQDIINDLFLTFNFSIYQLVIIYHSILFYYFIGQNHVICNTSRSTVCFKKNGAHNANSF